jgi:predicted NUDIX family phosphoesterase
MSDVKPVFVKDHDEEILVVNRKKLFPQGPPTSKLTSVDMESYQQQILDDGEYIWRSKAEVNPSYKQIIPYLVFNYKDTFFLMQRAADASDVRLRNKYSLGIGGHIRRADIEGGSFTKWAEREFAEEISYSGSFEVEPIGLVNNEDNQVGMVHTGFVFLLKGDSNDIAIRSELKSGKLVTIDEIEKVYENLETWSQIVFDYLKNN